MTRTEIINAIIKKNNYKSYLEIGVQTGANFSRVQCERKVGVDPDPASAATIHMTSEEYFKSILAAGNGFYGAETFDIIFIDGLHHCWQVFKDIYDSLSILNDGGTILCHDLNPPDEKSQQVPRVTKQWQGDGWMAWMFLRGTRHDIEMMVVKPEGLGIIRRGKQELFHPDMNITFANMAKNRKQWMNMVTEEEAGLGEPTPIINPDYSSRIHFPLVYQPGGNIGIAYNKTMELLPENDFACFLDADAMMTTYGYGEQLYHIVTKYPECGLFVATTNRIGCTWQLAGDWKSDDMVKMRAFGKKQADTFYDAVEDVTDRAKDRPFSGFLILISKKTWRAVGGFLEEGQLGVDNDLHRRAHESGEKVYLMKGVFLYHWYRGGNKHDKSNITILNKKKQAV